MSAKVSTISEDGKFNVAYVEDDFQVHFEEGPNSSESAMPTKGVMTAKQCSSNPTIGNEADDSDAKSRDTEKEQSSKIFEVKLYKKRFVILAIFCLCTMMNAVPWMQYAVIADIMSCYFGVTEIAVFWSSLVYMVMFLPLVLPVTWSMENKGLRFTVLMGATLNLLGSIIQCNAFNANRFPVAFVSQTIYACGQVFLLSVPPYVAGAWFGSDEVSSACAFGVFGNQIGNALGFIIPPLVLSDDCEDQDGIQQGLEAIAFSILSINALLLVTIFFVFDENPLHPPSRAQARKPKVKTKYLKSIASLMTFLPFNLLLICYGLITGVYFTISTMMNELVLSHFPGRETDAGWLGAVLIFAGIAGSLTFGYALDKTHKFKEITLTAFTVSFLCMLAHSVLLKKEMIWHQYIVFTLLGFFMTGYLPVGFEYGAEITYPECEATSAGLLNCSTQVFSIILTVIGIFLFKTFGAISVNLFCGACLFVGLIMAGSMKCDLKRTKENNEAKTEC